MNARIRWLRTERPTNTTMLEIPVYLVVLGVLGVVAAHSEASAQRHLRVIEGLALVSGARLSMMEYRAVTGDWPASNAEAGFSDASTMAQDRVSSVQIRADGAVDVTFAQATLNGKVLSVRAATQPHSGQPVVWGCGHARLLVGTIAAPDRTTLADADLPSPCRPHP
jgi:type IV pilus assembly protein PilA